jgi:methyl coenzyme M reductase beta subunit
MNNLVELIKNLPPLLKEEVIGESMKAIKDEAKQQVMKEIRRSAAIVVDDVTDSLITSRKTGRDIKRPEYTKDIDDELYYTFLDISERFVNKHAEKIVFDNTHHMDSYEDDEDSEQDEY